jgi:hypothetical protein
MKALLILGLLSLPAFAKDKPMYSYQSAVLQSFHTETTGTNCSSSADTSGTVHGDTDSSATIRSTTSGSSTCSDSHRVVYTIKVGENTLALTPYTPLKTEVGGPVALVWNKAFSKESVLAYQLPGTSLQIRTDGKHYYVKVGERESAYSIVGAQ